MTSIARGHEATSVPREVVGLRHQYRHWRQQLVGGGRRCKFTLVIHILSSIPDSLDGPSTACHIL